jgi:hypothetical protein
MGVDESGALAVLKAHRREILDPAIASHHGRIDVALGIIKIADHKALI